MMMRSLIEQSDIYDLFCKAEDGQRLTLEDGLRLFATDDIFTLAHAADCVRQRLHKDKTYYVINRHINYSNICVNQCRFCAFSRSRESQDAYAMSLDEVFAHADSLKTQGARELHIVGGLHPDLPYDYYVEMIRGLAERLPDVHLKAFSAVEIAHLAKLSNKSTDEVLRELQAAGLGSLPGGGAEIFSERVRKIVCPEKIPARTWLDVHRAAHKIGLHTTCTMLFGHVEKPREVIEHLIQLRTLQHETNGFTAFVPLVFHPAHTDFSHLPSPSGMSRLRHLAIARLLLDNIAHLKVYWVVMGIEIAQIGLSFGADDLDGTVVKERICHTAGADAPQELTREALCEIIHQAGRVPVERDALYHEISPRQSAGKHHDA